MPFEPEDDAPLAGEDRAALEAELLRAEARAEALERRLAVLSDTVQAAGSLLDPEMVSRFIMERAAALIGAEAWRLYRIDEAAGLMRLDARNETGKGAAPSGELPLAAGVAGWVARLRQPLLIDEAAADPRLDRTGEWPEPPAGGLIALPLVSRGRTIGIAELAAPAGVVFGPDDLGLAATLMEPAAIALDNALLFKRLEERTVTDDLTRLYNARFMENYLKRETKRARRFGRPVALLFLDLDGFKLVNDHHGHMAGSRTLVEVGELLRESVRDLDVVARWGGDEYAIVLADTDAAGALVIAERIRAAIAERRWLASLGLDVRLTVSIGVAACPGHGETPEELLAAADGAMYVVKYGGKNGVRLADPRG
ncbi:MAG: sensor domain-containing diguanylate cyclase [Candidatus Polarisedimenticolia bacterium]|nr:sensor domain-containing diguanylate cyclase [bacterium]